MKSLTLSRRRQACHLTIAISMGLMLTLFTAYLGAAFSKEVLPAVSPWCAWRSEDGFYVYRRLPMTFSGEIITVFTDGGVVDNGLVHLNSQRRVVDSRVVPALTSKQPTSIHLPVNDRLRSRNEYHFGWPFKSLWSAVDHLNIPQEKVFINIKRLWPSLKPAEMLKFETTKPFGQWTKTKIINVPTGILSIGFILNTFFYTTIALLILNTQEIIAHIHRPKRGCCQKCNYDLKGLGSCAVCPECGNVASS